MSLPPSFEPKHRRPRPSAAGAKPVGRSRADTPRNLRSTRSQNARPELPRDVKPHRDPVESFSSTQRPSAPVRHSAFESVADQQRDVHTPPPIVAPAPRATASHTPPPSAAPTASRKSWSRRKKLLAAAMVPLLLVVGLLGWGVYLYRYGNSRLAHVDALSGAADTPGDTYLIVGSDERHGAAKKSVQGMRADTIMLLNVPESGKPALISLPRDTLVTYADGSGQGKLNAALNIGGPKALVQTVEQLSGLTIDHYIMIGMDGVAMLTDAVGGINLCYNHDVNDSYSDLVWTAGCHDVDGKVALQFSRMRYSDPLGDIGRGQRQRQVVAKVLKKALSPGVILNPISQKELTGAVADVITVDDDDSLISVAMAGLDLRKVMGAEGLNGAPPIADMNYYAGGVSYVLLDEARAPQFWEDLREGTLTEDSFASF